MRWRSASIHAGRVRLALSRTMRSVSPSLDEAPQRAFLRRSGTPARGRRRCGAESVAKLRLHVVESALDASSRRPWRNHDHRNATAQRGEANGVCALVESDRLGQRATRSQSSRAGARGRSALRQCASASRRLAAGREVAPVRLGDAPVATRSRREGSGPWGCGSRPRLCPPAASWRDADSQSGDSRPPSIESPSKAS
jgi:hypothetical protein